MYRDRYKTKKKLASTDFNRPIQKDRKSGLSKQDLSKNVITGKSLSEAFILASTNPKYDDRLFIELRVQYKKTTSSEHVLYTNCLLVFFDIQNNNVHNIY